MFSKNVISRVLVLMCVSAMADVVFAQSASYSSLCQQNITSTAVLSQCAALKQFYTTSCTNAATSWRNQSGWDTAITASSALSTCCSWAGVACDENGTVVSVALSLNNMTCQIPSYWAFSLPKLGKLDMSRNRIYGTLPKEFGCFQHLENLNLEQNELAGSLPAQWSVLPSLWELNLNYNSLTGPVPVEWVQLTTLKWIYIGHNHLSGTLPVLHACTVFFCGNPDMQVPLNKIDWGLYSNTTGRCPSGTALFLVGVNVSGSIPCIPTVVILDISYSHYITGDIPCCEGLQFLGAEGTSIRAWSSAQPCVSTTMAHLFLSYSNISHLPQDLAHRFPNLVSLSAKYIAASQVLPRFPTTIEVLDLTGNAFAAPSISHADGGGAVGINVSQTFKYLDLTTNAENGVTLIETDFRCNGVRNNSDCAIKVGVFRALGSSLVAQANSGSAVSEMVKEENVLTPPIIILSTMRMVFHTGQDFLSPTFSGQFRPRLMVHGLVDHVALPDPTMPFSAGLVAAPEPTWNNTFIALDASPSLFSVFDGLKDFATARLLLNGVNYSVEVMFVYKPVLLLGSDPRVVGSLVKSLTGGYVIAPVCSSNLYGVPLTTVCTACPANCVCDGSPVLRSQDGYWRFKSTLLPLYRCESPGCVSSSGTQRLGPECADGFDGPLCSNCASGHGRDTTGSCVLCSADAWNWIAFTVGVVVFIGAASFAALKSAPKATKSAAAVAFREDLKHHEAAGDSDKAKKQEEKETPEERYAAQRNAALALAVKKVQNHMGMFSLVGRTVFAKDPRTVSVALQTVQQFSSQLSLRSVSFVTCLFPDMSAITQFQALLALIPVLLALELGLVYWRRGRLALVAVSSAILCLLYETAINFALQIIPTDELVFYDAAQYTVNRTSVEAQVTLRYLSLDRRVPVDDESRGWRAFAYIWLVIFGAGFPLFIGFCFTRLTSQYGLQYAKDNLSLLTSNFRSKRWYWEIAIMMRKMTLAVAVVGLRNYPLAQMQAVIFALMMYVVGLEWQVPFSSVWMHQAERTSCYGALIMANILMARGTISDLETSVNDISTGTSVHSGYSTATAFIQILAIIVMLVFLWLEWKRSARLLQLSTADENGDCDVSLDGGIYDERLSNNGSDDSHKTEPGGAITLNRVMSNAPVSLEKTLSFAGQVHQPANQEQHQPQPPPQTVVTDAMLVDL